MDEQNLPWPGENADFSCYMVDEGERGDEHSTWPRRWGTQGKDAAAQSSTYWEPYNEAVDGRDPQSGPDAKDKVWIELPLDTPFADAPWNATRVAANAPLAKRLSWRPSWAKRGDLAREAATRPCRAPRPPLAPPPGQRVVVAPLLGEARRPGHGGSNAPTSGAPAILGPKQDEARRQGTAPLWIQGGAAFKNSNEEGAPRRLVGP
jgi:hypothetical protein